MAVSSNWLQTLGLIVGLLLVAAWVEHWRHVRQLRRLPIRIHVNGTRGKSTVTRLIAGGLRAHGLRVVAKTTGTEPRLILEDGSEQHIHRRGMPSIAEQAWAIRRAVARGAEAVVLECMAVRPDLQWAAEHRLVRATIGVLTNVRRDHGDVMGHQLGEVAHSLCNTIPARGVLVTAERRCASIVQQRARRAQATVVPAEDDLTPEELTRFSRPEFRENIALALRVCSLLGVPREVALAGMQQAQPDPGAISMVTAQYGVRPFTFVNLLACNDIESVAHALEEQHLGDRSMIFLLCLRADRVARSRDFLSYFGATARFDHAIVLGPGAGIFRRRLVRQGRAAERVTTREWITPAGALDLVAEVCGAQPNGSLVVGMGNIVGLGGDIAHAIRERGAEEVPCLIPT